MGMTPSKQDDEDVMLEVNMTPLIDVMLVLIIMFIITIPIQNNAININMPTPSNSVPLKPPVIVNIVIKPNSDVTWNGEVVNEQELEKRFNLIAHEVDQDQVRILPETQSSYKDIARVMAAAQRLGVKNLGILNNNE